LGDSAVEQQDNNKLVGKKARAVHAKYGEAKPGQLKVQEV